MDTDGKRLRLLYPDIHGLERGKYLFGDWGSTGMAAFCIGVYPLTHDKEILAIPRTQFDVGLHDVEAMLDRESLRPGWEANTVIGLADVELHGQPAPWDTRNALREACRAWEDMGLEPQVAFELEFYLLEPGEDGTWQPVSIPGHRVYGTGMSVDPSGTIDDVVNVALGCGFPVESWCSEYDNAAYEVNIRYDDAIPAADEAFLFKLLVRETCERHGKLATFLGRPLGDRGGSGLHINLSFRRADGSNAFHDPNDPEGLSDLARRCIAGLLLHHEGMAAILAPHVNAYKRLQPDMLNGYWANWGHDDRSRHGAGAPRARRGDPARAADVGCGREPVPRGGRRPARGPAGRPERASSSRPRRNRGPRPTRTCGSLPTWMRRSTRSRRTTSWSTRSDASSSRRSRSSSAPSGSGTWPRAPTQRPRM